MEFDKELFNRMLLDKDTTTRDEIAIKYGLSDRMAGQYLFVLNNIDSIGEMFETDDEILEQNVKYKKIQQKYADLNRIERKSFREHARVENAISVYLEALVGIFDKNPYQPSGVEHKSSDVAVGVLQLSDLHFNELIDIKSNKYDFTVASKRIYKYVQEARNYFLLYGITDVFVFYSGDILNSDRRLDEILALATNRSKATFIAVQILENALVDLNKDFNLHLAGVCGNESRIKDDYHWNNEIVSDNYDFTVFNVLRYKLKDTKGINFLGLSDKHEEVVAVNGKNFLVIHGHQIGKDISKDLSKLIRKYAQMDIDIDYTIWGHLHEAMLSDTYSRSSALCGSNSYSEDALLLVGRASQNIYIVTDKDRIDSIRIDLQNTDGYAGYNTKDWQDAYNPKSVDKTKRSETILRITI